jgi:hypothetical protein
MCLCERPCVCVSVHVFVCYRLSIVPLSMILQFEFGNSPTVVLFFLFPPLHFIHKTTVLMEVPST